MRILSFIKTAPLFLLLLNACSSDEPEIQGYCVEFESTDANGNPENTFFAYNVKTFQEGQDLLNNRVGGGINEAIRENPCDQHTDICPQVWKPVCAVTESGSGQSPQKTYSNLCSLKSEVKKLSGSSSKAKADFQTDECKSD